MSQNSNKMTMEEMLDECIRVRPSYRRQVLRQLDDLLTALNRGESTSSLGRSEYLWILHTDGQTTKHAID